jgi:glycosyltransferase involved in cell wall biosynthesis
VKVLLISPLRELDPPCGDITYTEELISNMCHDVEYVTYDKAISDGSLVELTRFNWRVSPVILILNKLINLIRKARLLYWEPFRFFYIKPGVYNLVHVHHYPFKLLNKSCPVIYTSGAPLGDVYRDRRNYSITRTKVLSRLEYCLCRMFNVNHSSFFMPQVDRLAVYTDYYCNYIRDNVDFTFDYLVKIPIFLGDITTSRENHNCVRFGIVAYDFYSKGGESLISAFRKVREIDDSATLDIVGNVPVEIHGEAGVTIHGVESRKFIVEEFLPKIDVFVYPTPHDCFSYVMLEALRAGCAICTSDYVSMPEAVDYGKAGLISPVGDSEVLAENMIQMLDPFVRHEFQLAARRQFERKFDSAVVLSNMYDLYRNLVGDFAVTKSGNEKVVK